MAEQGSVGNLKVQSPKRQLYEVNSNHVKEEMDHVYAEVNKKKRRPESGSKSNKSRR